MKIYFAFLILSLLDQWIFHSYFTAIIIILLSIILLFQVINTLSKKINLFEILAFIAVMTYLIMPLFTYYIFNRQNQLAEVWQTYMMIDFEDYFGFALPATLMFIIGLFGVNAKNQTYHDQIAIRRCKEYLVAKPGLGFLLVATGLTFSFITPFMPMGFYALSYFLSQLTYIGLLYLLYSQPQRKMIYILIGLAMMVSQTMATGMYTELVYWTVLGGIILVLDKPFGWIKKITALAICIFLVFLIQSIKHEYREDLALNHFKKVTGMHFFS